MTGRYQTYPEYKESSVEWSDNIPKSWVEVPLKLLVSTRKGVAFKSADFCETGCKVVKASDIKNLTIENSIVYLPETFKNLYPKAVLNAGNIILSTVGSAAHVKNSAVGQLGRLPKKLAGSLLNQNTVIFEPNTGKISENYLFILLQMSAYRDHLDLHAHGTANQASLNISEMLSFYCVLPPFEEQQKIANFLDHETAKIDTLIAKQEKLIELLKEKCQAVISHAVTRGLNPDAPMKDSGVEWLGEVPEHWDVGRYKFCTKRIIVGIAEAATHAYADSGVPIVRSTNIKEEELETQNLLFLKPEFAEKNSSKYLFHNDVVTVRTGYPGISAVVPESLNKSHCFTNLVATPLELHHPKFLSEYLNSYIGKAYFDLFSWGSAQQNISVPILQNFPIAFPSADEELEIVEYLKTQRAKFKKLITKAKYSIELMKERKTALISAAVTGKMDVRNWQASEVIES
jgi:type I restriction enzyme S subunit